jgi:hypothetical protein
MQMWQRKTIEEKNQISSSTLNNLSFEFCPFFGVLHVSIFYLGAYLCFGIIEGKFKGLPIQSSH